MAEVLMFIQLLCAGDGVCGYDNPERVIMFTVLDCSLKEGWQQDDIYPSLEDPKFIVRRVSCFVDGQRI